MPTLPSFPGASVSFHKGEGKWLPLQERQHLVTAARVSSWSLRVSKHSLFLAPNEPLVPSCQENDWRGRAALRGRKMGGSAAHSSLPWGVCRAASPDLGGRQIPLETHEPRQGALPLSLQPCELDLRAPAQGPADPSVDPSLGAKKELPGCDFFTL